MKSMFIFLFLNIFNLNRVFGACKSSNCVAYFGTKFYVDTSGAKLLNTQTMQMNTNVYNEAPCCEFCVKTIGCTLYQLNFTNESCSAYSLPASLALNNQFIKFIQGSDRFHCIGFPYSFLGYP